MKTRPFLPGPPPLILTVLLTVTGCSARYVVGQNGVAGSGGDGARGPGIAGSIGAGGRDGTGTGGAPAGTGATAGTGIIGTGGTVGDGGTTSGAGSTAGGGGSSAGAPGGAAPKPIAFAAGINYQAGDHPKAIAIGDLDGDGKVDLAVAGGSTYGGGVSVLLGHGDGSFDPVSYSSPSDSVQASSAVAIGDLNGDGKPDLVVGGTMGSTWQVGVFINHGGGTFDDPVDVGNVTELQSLALGDLNGDGKVDLVATSSFSGLVTIFLNTGNATFSTPISYTAGDAPSTLALGDLNGDGKPELVVTNATTDRFGVPTATAGVRVFVNKGNGTFMPPVSYVPTTNPVSLALGDLSGDGKADLVWLDGTNHLVYVLINTGTGTFGAPVTYQSGLEAGVTPIGLSVGDLDGDGKPDVVFVDSSGGVDVLTNNGNGTFPGSLVRYATGAHAESVTVGDLNHDGRADLVVASGIDGNGYVTALLGDRNGGLSAAGVSVSPEGVLTPSNSSAIGDVNGDGTPDLILAHAAVGNSSSPGVDVLLGTGQGSFGANFATYEAFDPSAVTLADLNGDGSLDLAVCNPSNRNVSVFSNDGKGTYGDAVNYTTGTSPTSLAVGDLNGDGRPDMAVANQDSNNISVFLSTANGKFAPSAFYGVGGGVAAGGSPVSIAIADLNGDGKKDVAVGVTDSGGLDVIGILMNNGDGTLATAVKHRASPYGLVAGDFNADGKVDLAVTSRTGTVSVLLSRGGGTFAPSVDYTVGGIDPGNMVKVSGRPLAIGDLNGDGKIDLALASDDGNLTVLLNHGDGTFFHAVDFAAGGNLWSVAIGDLNGDGKPDLVANGTLAGVHLLWNTTP